MKTVVRVIGLLCGMALAVGLLHNPEGAGRWYAKAERAYHQEKVR